VREERTKMHILTKWGGRKWEEEKERSRACVVVSTSCSFFLPSRREGSQRPAPPSPTELDQTKQERQKRGKPKVRACVKKESRKPSLNKPAVVK
jgi:hypothetical protein